VLHASVAGGAGLLEAAAALHRSGTPFEVYKRGVRLGLWQEGAKRRANAGRHIAIDIATLQPSK
jgi:hypothetical protein